MISRYTDAESLQVLSLKTSCCWQNAPEVDTDENISGFIEPLAISFAASRSVCVRKALESGVVRVARVDKMISDAKPWELAKR